jgi:hypothetical protein
MTKEILQTSLIQANEIKKDLTIMFNDCCRILDANKDLKNEFYPYLIKSEQKKIDDNISFYSKMIEKTEKSIAYANKGINNLKLQIEVKQ